MFKWLRRNDLVIEKLMSSLQTALLVIKSDFSIVFANEAALALLETGEKQLKGKQLFDFFSEDSFSKERVEEAIFNGKVFAGAEVQLFFRDGRCTLVDISVTMVEDLQEELLVFEIKLVDQQRKITHEALQHAQQQAARDLIRGLAHEIKNPLGGIRGAAQLLEKELPNPEQTEFTQMIIEQADRLRALVDRLLGPNSLPQKDWHNLHEIIEKVAQLVNSDVNYNIQFHRDYDPSIPDLFIDGDMIQQAILNVIRNSVQAISSHDITSPSILLRSRIDRQVTINGDVYPLCALIKVIDNGPGIPKELKDTLFYPMVTTKQDGSGLGLSIAQTLIGHHNGKIDVESYAGHTEFTFYLPIVRKEEE